MHTWTYPPHTLLDKLQWPIKRHPVLKIRLPSEGIQTAPSTQGLKCGTSEGGDEKSLLIFYGTASDGQKGRTLFSERRSRDGWERFCRERRLSSNGSPFSLNYIKQNRLKDVLCQKYHQIMVTLHTHVYGVGLVRVGTWLGFNLFRFETDCM